MDILTEKGSEQMQRKSLRERENRQKNQCQRGEMKVQTRNGGQVKFSGTSGSFWRLGVKVSQSFPIGLHRKEADEIVTKYIHTLFSHHALGSFNILQSRIQGCFNFCSTMRRDIGRGHSPKKIDETTGQDLAMTTFPTRGIVESGCGSFHERQGEAVSANTIALLMLHHHHHHSLESAIVSWFWCSGGAVHMKVCIEREEECMFMCMCFIPHITALFMLLQLLLRLLFLRDRLGVAMSG